MSSWPPNTRHSGAAARAASSRTTAPKRPVSVTGPGGDAGIVSTAGPTGCAGSVMFFYLLIVAEKFVQLVVGNQAGETVEFTVMGDFGRSADERMHGNAGQ